jgi:hypothetical protein
VNHATQIISNHLASSRALMLPTAVSKSPCVFLSAFTFYALRSSLPARLALSRAGRRAHGAFLREAQVDVVVGEVPRFFAPHLEEMVTTEGSSFVRAASAICFLC